MSLRYEQRLKSGPGLQSGFVPSEAASSNPFPNPRFIAKADAGLSATKQAVENAGTPAIPTQAGSLHMNWYR